MEKKCNDCGKKIQRRMNAYQIEITNSFGDKRETVYVCKSCYTKRKKKSDLYYIVASLVSLCLGVLTLFYAHGIAIRIEIQPLVIQIGAIALIGISIVMLIYKNPDFLR